jgi:ABC-type multidrug transport system ATPase subunit
VTYNSKGLDEIQPRRVAAFIGQTDRHLPLLTVRETVEFAYKCASLFPGEVKKGTEAAKVSFSIHSDTAKHISPSVFLWRSLSKVQGQR